MEPVLDLYSKLKAAVAALLMISSGSVNYLELRELEKPYSCRDTVETGDYSAQLLPYMLSLQHR